MNQNLVMDAAGTPPFTYDVKASELKTLSTSTALMDDLRLGAGVRLDAILYSLPGIMEAIKNGYPSVLLANPLSMSRSPLRQTRVMRNSTPRLRKPSRP